MTTSLTRLSALDGLAGPTLLASAAVGAAGVAFLVAMFVAFGAGAQAAGRTLGWINDVLVVLTYLLAIPGVMAVGARLRGTSPLVGGAGTWIALASIVVIVVLQMLLVVGVFTFEEEIGPVSIGYLGLFGWFVATAVVGRRVARFPVGLGTAIIAALYVGYPVWALRVGRWLSADA